ncbi:MAG: hypothetical protein WDM86_00330 [Rhizomicrobium sp.]
MSQAGIFGLAATATRLGQDAMAAAPGLRSLAALHMESWEAGRTLLADAHRAEPFEPLHQVRTALFHARFGRFADGIALLRDLQEQGVSAPLIDYLRALFSMRAGRADQARAIASAIETAHPDFGLARFLRAEAQIVLAPNAARVERYLRGLPDADQFLPCWADLLVKLVLLHPKDGPALAMRHRKRIGPRPELNAILDKVLDWTAAGSDQLAAALAGEAAGSRAEAILLQIMADRLAADASANASSELRVARWLSALCARFPDRGALRQLALGFHTRLAAEAASQGDYPRALRFTERSLSGSPYDLVYQQNQAALFTLMREQEAYHDAWQMLNRQQYRLLLLGVTGPLVGQIIKTHRVFAEQSFHAGTFARGLFSEKEDEEGYRHLIFNQDIVKGDPDVLPQWFHHKRAELLFSHFALAVGAGPVLLDPADRDQASARAAALTALGQSLSVLVMEEGAELSQLFAKQWSDAAALASTHYAAMTERGAQDTGSPDVPDAFAGDEARALLRQHLIALAEACLICWRWSPDYSQMSLAEDLREWLAHEFCFADPDLLNRIQGQPSPPYALSQLAGSARRLTLPKGLASEASMEGLRAAVADAEATLLRAMSLAAYEGAARDQKERAQAALSYISRARAASPSDSKNEFRAAEMFTLGGYFDEARRAIGRFRQLDDSQNEWLRDSIEKLDETLAEHRRKGEAGQAFAATDIETTSAGDPQKIEALQAEIADAPSSWRLYADLVRQLVLADRFDDAIEWSDRCVARCLTRTAQISARELALEARGLRTLATRSPRAVKLHALGAFEAGRRALQELSSEEIPFDCGLHFLYGRCRLEAGLPQEALESFRAAYALSAGTIYRPVLRRLTEDIDEAYLSVARSTIDTAIKDDRLDEAVAEACRVIGRLNHPQTWLIDLARTFCSVSARRGSREKPAGIDDIGHFAASWRSDLVEALRQPDETATALAIAALAREIVPESADRAQVVIERAQAQQHQQAVVAALEHAGTLLGERRFDDAKTFIEGLDEDLRTQPRIRRLYVLALLALNRFDEADLAIAQFGEVRTAELREFVDSYPRLAFRQHIALASRLLRDGNADDALNLLANLEPPDETEGAELNFRRAFATAMKAYERRKQGDAKGAIGQFQAALGLLDPYMTRSSIPSYMAELFERLEGEVDRDG